LPICAKMIYTEHWLLEWLLKPADEFVGRLLRDKDGMPCVPIQCQGHVALKIRNSSIFKSISSAIFNGSWQVTADSLTTGQYLNFIGLEIIYFLVFGAYWLLDVFR